MALLFFDGFDHYAISQIGLKWTTAPGAASLVAGRTGNALHLGDSGISAEKQLPNSSTLIVGFAYKPTTTGLHGDYTQHLIQIMDGASVQITLDYQYSVGKLRVWRGNQLVLLGTGTTFINSGSYIYVEIKVTFATGPTGSVEVRLNGNTVAEIKLTNVQTSATANAYANSLRLVPGAFWEAFNDFDDVYVCDDTGTYNNDFLGDSSAVTILPVASGGLTQWTPSAGQNWQNVKEVAPNDDVDYNSSAAPDQTDTYNYADLAATGGYIRGIQTCVYARKDDVGLRSVAPIVRQVGTNFIGPAHALSTVYAYYFDLYETNPATGQPFQLNEVNADEFGVKVIA